ncbi:MAG: SOS response-associated peptidase [Bacteroidota bacterium]|nr:SOS response-associated peptidase [Bacteroidota bacterium]
MCFQVQLVLEYTRSDAYWNQRILEEVRGEARYHHTSAFAREPWPIVTMEDPEHIRLMHCGLVPSHMKDAIGFLKQYSTYNAKSEEIYEKRTFAEAANGSRRCLIPVTGFFEWMHRGKQKFPHYIRKKGGGIMHFGGLYEGDTYTILTTEANTRMAEIHNSKRRMPVIVPEGQERHWLDPSLTQEDVMDLCRSAPNEYLEDWSVSRLITSHREETNVAEVWAPHRYAELDPSHDHNASLFPG